MFGGATQTQAPGDRLRAAEERAAEAERNAGAAAGGVGKKRRFTARIVAGRGKGAGLCAHDAGAGCSCWSVVGPRGLKVLYDATSGKRVRRRITGARGRELQDLDAVLDHVREWHASAFPKKTFEAFALALEGMGRRGNVQAHLEGLKELGFGLKDEAEVLSDMKYMMGEGGGGPTGEDDCVPLAERGEEGEGEDEDEGAVPWGPDAPTPARTAPPPPPPPQTQPQPNGGAPDEEDLEALFAADGERDDAYQEEEALLDELGM